MGVLPKGQTWPNTCTDAITNANKRLQEYAEKHKPWLQYIDLGNRFLTHQVKVWTPSQGTHNLITYPSARLAALQLLLCQSVSMPAACTCTAGGHAMGSLPDDTAAKLLSGPTSLRAG
jgi:hypothetical protein